MSAADKINERIKELREIGQLTMGEIAEELGVTAYRVRQVLGKGKRGRQDGRQYRERIKRGLAMQDAARGQLAIWARMIARMWMDCCGSESALIVDVDDVLLDTTPYSRRLIATGKQFPSGWDTWCKKAMAKPVSNMQSLLTYLTGDGPINIHAVSSRHERLQECTVANITRHYPMINPDQIVCAGDNKWEYIRCLAGQHDVGMVIDDKAMPPVENIMLQIVWPNYVYGAHASACR